MFLRRILLSQWNVKLSQNCNLKCKIVKMLTYKFNSFTLYHKNFHLKLLRTKVVVWREIAILNPVFFAVWQQWTFRTYLSYYTSQRWDASHSPLWIWGFISSLIDLLRCHCLTFCPLFFSLSLIHRFFPLAACSFQNLHVFSIFFPTPLSFLLGKKNEKRHSFFM